MSKYQLFIAAEASGPAEKTTILKLKRIREADSETWFSMPEDSQALNTHKSIADLAPVKSASSSIKTRGQFRNVNVIFSPDIEEKYRDEAGNFLYNGYLLPEFQLPSPQSSEPGSGIPELVACLTKIAEKKDDSLKETMKHFLVEKFSTKNKNVVAWIDGFEKEALRFSLKGSKLIEVFRLCLDSSMNDWFLSSQKKLGIDSPWKMWKEDLISTFCDLSWKPVRFAYNFRYLNGSYVDFVVKKERILLELDHNIPEQIMLNLIVLGLPTQIQNSLNRSSITNVKILLKKLKKYDGETPRNAENPKNAEPPRNTSYAEATSSKNLIFTNSEKNKKPQPPPTGKNTTATEKKPCPNCEKNGRGVRYHPENLCWFKEKTPSLIKSVNNVALESDLNSLITDQKN